MGSGSTGRVKRTNLLPTNLNNIDDRIFTGCTSDVNVDSISSRFWNYYSQGERKHVD